MTQKSENTKLNKIEKTMDTCDHPLEITIRGTGQNSGKTFMQLNLAQMLEAVGHKVTLSDETCSARVLAGSIERRKFKTRPMIPMRIHLRVSSETISGNCDGTK